MLRFLTSTYNYIRLLWKAYSLIDKYQDTQLQHHDINEIVQEITPYIERCGCVCIKFCQWATPILDILVNESHKKQGSKPYWLSCLEKFYENCENHSFTYTSHLFKQEFGESISDNYEVVSLIGSGSIGQVYKLKSIHTDDYYALKVIHPKVAFDMWYFKQVLRVCYTIERLRKVIQRVLPYDIHKFFDVFEKQIDLIHEANNLCRIHYNYRKNDYIHIPQLIRFSRNLLLMSYEEGFSIEDPQINQYDKMKLINLLSMFNKNSFEVNRFNHGDLHIGNWKIQPYKDHYRLVIFDFGFCWYYRNDRITDNLTNALIDSDHTNLKPLIQFIYDILEVNDETMYQVIEDKVRSHITEDNIIGDPQKVIYYTLEICQENKIIIDPVVFQCILVFIQVFKYMDTYGLSNSYEKYPTSDLIYRNIYPNTLAICESYQIFPEISQKLRIKLNEKQPTVSGLFDSLDHTKHITKDIRALLKFDS